jgi:eukaryotic-like serine/threonine-protein kinase
VTGQTLRPPTHVIIANVMSFDPPASGSFPQVPPAPSLVGEVVDGRYKIFRKLGEGGMGEVYAAEHVHIEKRFAVKLLKAEIVSNAEAVKRFQQEARSSSSIKHRNIIAVEDFGRLPDGRIYMCMELLDGEPLNEMIAKPLSADRLLNILIQAGHGLAAAHAKGIVHRDMKPENIFVTHEGNPPTDVPKLLDFGIAKVAGNEGQNNLTRTGTIFGTPFYMAPEQALGNPVDARTDIYAMGVIMYECFAGSLPFQSASFMGILTQHITNAPEPVAQRAAAAGRSLPPGVAEIIGKCLEKDPNARYQTMDELVNALIGAYRNVAGPGMSTYMEAFPVGSAQHNSQPTPAPMIGMHGATPYGHAAQAPSAYAGQSQPALPAAGHSPSGTGAALSGVYDPSSSIVVPKKHNVGIIVAILILLAAGGGIAAVVLLGGSKDTKQDDVAGLGSNVVVATNTGGDTANTGTDTPDIGTPDTKTPGTDPPDNGSAGGEVGSGGPVNLNAGSDTPLDAKDADPNHEPGDTVVPEAPKGVDVMLVVSNVTRFEIWDGTTLLGEGPDRVVVPKGVQRTVTIKAKGFKDKPVVLDGKQKRVTTKLVRALGQTTTTTTTNTNTNTNTTPTPPKLDCSREILKPDSAACRRQYCASHKNDARCLTIDDD